MATLSEITQILIDAERTSAELDRLVGKPSPMDIKAMQIGVETALEVDRALKKLRGRPGGRARKAKHESEGEPLIPFLERAYAGLTDRDGKQPGREKLQSKLESIVSRSAPNLFDLITQSRVRAFLKSKRKK